MRWILLFALLLSCGGCSSSVPASSGTALSGSMAKGKTAAEPQPPTFAPKVDPDGKPPEAPPPPKPIEMVREVARAGASDKGKYDAGIFTTPLTANFSLKEQLIFEAAIPKAMQLFETSRNRRPTTHQEFMTEIIAKSNIRLPSLPPNHRYIYDPQRGELMIERPRSGD